MKYTLLFALLLTACTKDRSIEEISEVLIPPEGGQALSFDGLAQIEFPAGAFNEPTLVTIRTLRLEDQRLLTPIYEAQAERRPATSARVRLASPQNGWLSLARVNAAGVFPLATIAVTEGAWISAEVQALAAYAVASGVAVPPPSNPDAGRADLGAPDQGAVVDAGEDAGPMDLSRPDAGPTDSGPLDGGAPDSGPADQGLIDQGPSDTGLPDIGLPDMSLPDIGPSDLGVPDAGPPPPAPSCGLSAIAEQEPNNTLQTATQHPGPLSAWTPFAGSVTPGDADWYSFNIPSNAALRLSTSTALGDPSVCAGADTRLTLTDTSGQQLAQDDPAGCAQLELAGLAPGSYAARVEGNGGYFLHITSLAATGGPDIMLSAVLPAVTAWPVGTTQNVVMCLENAGDAFAGMTELGLFLSDSPIVSAQSLLILQTSAPPLAAGAVLELSVQLPLPARSR